MKILKILSIVLFIIILLLIILTFITSHGVTQIVDLVHSDTNAVNVTDEYNFSDTTLNKYELNNILFIPYMVKNPPQNKDDKFYTYSLRLETYKQNNDCKVIINNVTIDGVQNVYFNKLEMPVKEELVFDDNHIQSSDVVLAKEINNYDMKLNKKSVIKVIINASVEENGEIVTNDLEYDFTTKISRYLIQQ